MIGIMEMEPDNFKTTGQIDYNLVGYIRALY